MALDEVRRSDPLRLSLSGYGVKKRLLLFRYIGQDLTEICMPLEQVIDFSTSAGPMRLLHFSKRPTINKSNNQSFYYCKELVDHI